MNLDRFISHPTRSLCLILGVSTGIKLVLLVMFDTINPDAVRYVNAAHELLRGDFHEAFSHDKMLAFTWLLGLTHLLVPDWFLAGKLLSALPLVLVTLPLYLMARDLFGVRAALAACLIFSVNPYDNSLATEVIKGPLFLLCIVTSLWLVVRGLRNGRWHNLLAASLLGLLATLFRVEGVVYLVTVIVMLSAWACFGSHSLRWRLQALFTFSVLPVTVVLAAAAAFLGGGGPPEILARVQERFGYYFSLQMFDNYQAIYQHLHAVEDRFSGGQWSNDFFALARQLMPLIYLVGLMLVFAKAIFPVFLLPLGFGLKLKKYWNAPLAVFLAVILGFLCMDYLFLLKNNFLSSRYLLVPVVLSLVLAGYGLVRLLEHLPRRGPRTFVVVLVFFLCIIVPVTESFSVLADEKPVLQAAGRWLEKHRDLDQLQIITNNEQVVYYAGLMRRSYQVFPPAGENDYAAQALRQAAELMVLERPVGEGEERPVFNHFQSVAEFADRQRRILVYERVK